MFTVGYNVQTAVDTKNRLIIAHYVTNDCSDRGHLSKIGKCAQEATGVTKLTVYADRGYFNSDEVKKAQDAKMTPIVPRTQTSPNRVQGLFTKDDFIYDQQSDAYICPAGKKLTPRFDTTQKNGKLIKVYSSTVAQCGDCQQKSACTPTKARRGRRLEHEDSLEKMQAIYEANPDVVTIRKSTAEHPFGTI